MRTSYNSVQARFAEPPSRRSSLACNNVGSLQERAWVILLAVEAWAPPDEVREAYRIQQQAVIVESTPSKTQTRAFDVARFVWDEERVHGKRPPWSVLWERWNNRPLTEPFKGWRDLRTYFLRSEQATRPRYKASDEQITKQVESGAHRKAFDSWMTTFRK